jgi:hypothetical protein
VGEELGTTGPIETAGGFLGVFEVLAGIPGSVFHFPPEPEAIGSAAASSSAGMAASSAAMNPGNSAAACPPLALAGAGGRAGGAAGTAPTKEGRLATFTPPWEAVEWPWLGRPVFKRLGGSRDYEILARWAA